MARLEVGGFTAATCLSNQVTLISPRNNIQTKLKVSSSSRFARSLNNQTCRVFVSCCCIFQIVFTTMVLSHIGEPKWRGLFFCFFNQSPPVSQELWVRFPTNKFESDQWSLDPAYLVDTVSICLEARISCYSPRCSFVDTRPFSARQTQMSWPRWTQMSWETSDCGEIQRL